ncbi:2Fe-2S iron-sulfur cluster-binding protein [Pseudomonas sp. Au-Pse12]|uniref:2Fe-2S iron-sulfur cluster-binding protein n=1 Tax=Pseudomonas sp. Au-Pse12 TaxID=2906459 RepID=UPI001E4D7CEB|nr:ferredoxin--NADP reductase [Pseudomonas sp. Au-Pse12]MCE4052306.1 ferredoxin--NADP reductase [Pseudomonas sp. Au-Pse12]
MCDPSAPAGAASATGSFRLQVAAVIEETADARSLVLDVPRELRERFRYKPGQFLSVRVPCAGQLLTRCYSMASSPLCDPQPKITVKRVAGGRVSNWMNQQVQVGDWLEVLPPAGHFCLAADADEQRPLVLFAGGSGITPVFSILQSVLHAGHRPVTLVYANRDEASVIFKEPLQQLARTHEQRLEVLHLLDSVQGFVTPTQVRQLLRLRRGGEYFICGPAPFMDTVESTLLALGEPRQAIHVERFASPPDPRPPVQNSSPPAPAQPCQSLTVELDGQSHTLAWRPGETLLQSCRAAGLEVPASCEEGICGACMCRVEQGRTRLASNAVLSAQELADGWTLACQSHADAPLVRVRFPD